MTAHQRLFGVVYLSGLLVVLAGLALQLIWRIDALLPALIVLGLTRVALSTWQLLQSGITIGKKPARARLTFTICAWVVVVLLLITVELTK